MTTTDETESRLEKKARHVFTLLDYNDNAFVRQDDETETPD
jgi:hypothetical protein